MISSSVAGDSVVADLSETVVLMAPDDVTSLPGVFKAVRAVIVADLWRVSDH